MPWEATTPPPKSSRAELRRHVTARLSSLSALPDARVQAELDKEDVNGLAIQIVPSDDAIEETEQPALALRRKPKASVMVATGLVKEGMADAVVSMGSTGALMASAHFLLGTLENLDRPVLGGPALGYAPNTIWLDMGGNVDARPAQFLDFAAIGVATARALP